MKCQPTSDAPRVAYPDGVVVNRLIVIAITEPIKPVEHGQGVFACHLVIIARLKIETGGVKEVSAEVMQQVESGKESERRASRELGIDLRNKRICYPLRLSGKDRIVR